MPPERHQSFTDAADRSDLVPDMWLYGAHGWRENAMAYETLPGTRAPVKMWADPAAVDDLVATFLQTEDQRFFPAVALLGADRELATLLHAFEGAAESGAARVLADRLLRIVFHDQRTGWGEIRSSVLREAGAAAPARGSQDLGRNMLKMIFQLLGTMLLWKLFPFLLRRKLRKSAAKRKGREKIEYWGLEGAAPELPAQLTADQQAVLTAFAAKPALWEFRTNLWELFGLPDSAEALRAFIDART